MNGHSIEEVSKEKDLGVIIDEHLKRFHEHTSYVINEVNCMIGIIRKTFTNLSSDTFLNLYKCAHNYRICNLGPFLQCGSNKSEKCSKSSHKTSAIY